MKETGTQFSQPPASSPVVARLHQSTLCPACQQYFAPDAQFCPFDGTALEASERAPHNDPLLGVVIDQRYQVEGVLGEGGMGTVYEVKHVALGRSFALKVLRADLASEGELGARFLQEARAAARINHPNVVQITDFGTLPSGQTYFVMELLSGTSLRELLRREGAIQVTFALELIRQVALALGAAHGAGIIHRDLKPDNIQIIGANSDQPVIKVLDFGLAKVAGASRLTKKGIVFGTPHYMSPEQAAGDELDQRVDIYALGIVMYEMFTGRVPFEADSFMGVLTKHMYMQPVPPSQILESTTLGELEAVTLRCLEKDPAKRFPTMAALVEEIDQIRDTWSANGLPKVVAGAAGARLSLSQRQLPPVFEPITQGFEVEQPARRWPTWASIALGVSLLVLATGVWLWRGRGGPKPLTDTQGLPQLALPKPALPSTSAPTSTNSSAPQLDNTEPEAVDPEGRKPSQSGSRVAPTHPESAKSPKRLTKKARFGAGELVDPWAR